MKTSERRQGDGIGTAKAVLSLIDEHSAQDFEAAEKILGANGDLVRLVKLLRELKEREEMADQPLTVEAFAAVVRRELLGLPLEELFSKGFPRRFLPGEVVRALGSTNPASVLESHQNRPEQLAGYVDLTLGHIHRFAPTPSAEVGWLARLLLSGAWLAGEKYFGAALSLLKELTIRALAENDVGLPALYSLAELRQWDERPLSYSPLESRERVAERLVKDLDRFPDVDAGDYLIDLLTKALRLPGEGAVAAVKRLATKKGKANGDR